MEKIYASPVIGLELNVTGLKAAEVYFSRGKAHIKKLHHFFFDTGRLEMASHYLTEEERSSLDLSGKTVIISAMDADETLVRPLDIKLKKEKDIDSVLLFQSEPLLPYPIDEALLDKIVLDTYSEGTLLTLLAIKKDHLRSHLEHWKAFSIEPEVVSTTPAALAAFSRYLLPNEKDTYYLLHVGIDQTCCIFIKNGHLIASKTSSLHLNTLRLTIQKDTQIEQEELLDKTFSEINWDSLDPNQFPLTAQAVKDFSIEINKLIFALMKQVREIEFPKILLTGELIAHPPLSRQILDEFQNHLLIPLENPSNQFSIEKQQIHAIPIGAALTALPTAKDQVNFLQGDFVYSYPWKRFKKSLLIYFTLCALLALSFYLFGQAYIAYQENELKHQYAALLTTIQKSHPELEAELSGKTSLEEIPPSIHKLSQEDLNLRLRFLESKLRTVPNLFQLTPNVPRVSDLLAWLATHPNVVNKENAIPLIHIEGINYSLVKRPDLSKKQEKYQVKVELDFTSSNQTAAREFHDALLAPNPFIDPRTEVKWTNNKGQYKAIFMLKDKTVYP